MNVSLKYNGQEITTFENLVQAAQHIEEFNDFCSNLAGVADDLAFNAFYEKLENEEFQLVVVVTSEVYTVHYNTEEILLRNSQGLLHEVVNGNLQVIKAHQEN